MYYLDTLIPYFSDHVPYKHIHNCVFGLALLATGEVGWPRKFLRISEKVWQEMHQNLKFLSQIEEASLKLKNQKRFIFRPRSIHTGQKTGPKISCDSPFKKFADLKSIPIKLWKCREGSDHSHIFTATLQISVGVWYCCLGRLTVSLLHSPSTYRPNPSLTLF